MNTVEEISFTDFVRMIKRIDEICTEAITNDLTLEELFDNLQKNNITVESVMTGDIADVTVPLGTLRRKGIYEYAPKSKDAEEWIKSNKNGFKKRYGDNWQQVLYATAWKLFGSDK